MKSTRDSGAGGETTYWGGEPANCSRIWVRVDFIPSSESNKWYGGLSHRNRRMVKVQLPGLPGRIRTIYIDDEDGKGWMKVTAAKGKHHGMWSSYRSIPDYRVQVISDREATDYGYLQPGKVVHVYKTGHKDETWCGMDNAGVTQSFILGHTFVQPDWRFVHLASCNACIVRFLRAKYPGQFDHLEEVTEITETGNEQSTAGSEDGTERSPTDEGTRE